jgi:segregation and condensation protein A
MNAPLDISLPRFEGPLDLLLALVRKNDIEITEIPIAEITRQYLSYMKQAEEMDLDLGSEFAWMAATLIEIKSRGLLPADPALAAREPDPRQELVRQLLEHEQVRQAAEFLKQQLELTGASWSRSPADELEKIAEEPDQVPPEGSSLNVLDVLRLARQALDTARNYDLLGTEAAEITVEEMMVWLERRLAAGGALSCDELFAEQDGRPRQVALFLAMLELSRLGGIRLEQPEDSDPITVLPPGTPRR